MHTTAPSTLILGTAGHIDHGKTSLVQVLTGIDTDRLPQEKQRGITIDIGFAQLDLPPFRLGVVDVPGHERFIRNMLAGASGVDLVLLVVAADDSVMPQTREHLSLCQLLDIRHGVIAITKADLADELQLEIVRDDIEELVSRTFLNSAPIIETSVSDSRGIKELRAALAETCQHVQRRSERDVFRMAIDRSFHRPGHGTIVTGTIASGHVKVEDQVQCMPGSDILRVRNLHSHGQTVTQATRGQRTAINLASVHHKNLLRGFELTTPGYLRPTTYLLTHVHVLPDSPFPIKNRSRVRVHLGTQSQTAYVNLFDRTVLEQGQMTWMQLVCHEPVVAEGGQPIVLRSESPTQTLGGGHVWWQPKRRLNRKRFEQIAPNVEQLQNDNAFTRVTAAIALYGHQDWTTLDLCRDTRITRDQAQRLLQEARQDDVLIAIPLRSNQERLVHHEHINRLTIQCLNRIRQLHEVSTTRRSVERAKVIAAMSRGVEPLIAEWLVEHLRETGQILGDEQRVAMPEFQAMLTDKQQQLLERVVTLTREAGIMFLDESKLSKILAPKPEDLATVLAHAVDEQHLISLGEGHYLHQETFEDVLKQLQSAFERKPAMTLAEIRNVLNTTRRYALPVCEYLDQVGITSRNDNLRRWIGPATHT